MTDRVDRLLRSRARFLRFLERRLGSRADAEDLLQAAFLKALAWEGTIHDDEKVVQWFYQVLRNLLADHHRTRVARGRLATRLAAEAPTAIDPDSVLFRTVCACVRRVAESLPPRHADLIRRAELGDASLRQVAAELDITPNNAAVRLHRARRALVAALRAACGACAEHHCLDCTCRSVPRAL